MPVVLSRTGTDCGIACLACVGLFHKLPYTYDQLAVLAGHLELGISLERLRQIAETMGLKAAAVKLHFSELKHLPRGAILFWQQAHFVVLSALTPEGLEIMDPSSGDNRIPLTEAAHSFSGAALLLSLDRLKTVFQESE